MPNDPKVRKDATRSLMARGVDLLSRREHSKKELREKLMARLAEGETIDDVEAVLVKLQEKGYLSDARYAEARVRIRSERFGDFRLAQELGEAGVDASDIREAMENLPPERERAKAVWERRFGHAPADGKEREKQIRFLLSRGFSYDAVNTVIEDAKATIQDGSLS